MYWCNTKGIVTLLSQWPAGSSLNQLKPKKGHTTWDIVEPLKERDTNGPCGSGSRVLTGWTGIGNTLKHRWQYYSLDNNCSSHSRLLYLFSETHKQVPFSAAQRRISVVADHIMKRNTPGPHPPSPFLQIPPLFDLMTHHVTINIPKCNFSPGKHVFMHFI